MITASPWVTNAKPNQSPEINQHTHVIDKDAMVQGFVAIVQVLEQYVLFDVALLGTECLQKSLLLQINVHDAGG